jgi:hypothetical protein
MPPIARAPVSPWKYSRVIAPGRPTAVLGLAEDGRQHRDHQQRAGELGRGGERVDAATAE